MAWWDEGTTSVAPMAPRPTQKKAWWEDEGSAEAPAPVPSSEGAWWEDEARAPTVGPTQALAPYEGKHPFDETGGIDELKGLPDWTKKRVREWWEEAKESPWKALAPGVDVVVTEGAIIGDKLAGLFDAEPKLYERWTGEKFLRDGDLAQLPPEERRRAQRRQQTIVENLAEEIFELGKAVPALVGGAARGTANVWHRAKRAAEKGETTLGILDAATKGVQDTGAGILAGLGKSVVDLAIDPVQAIHDGPLEQLANVSGIGGAGLRVAKGGASAARFQQALAPTHHLRSAGTKLVAKVDPKVGQWLLDKRIGVEPALLDKVDEYKVSVAAKTARRLDELAEARFDRLKPAQAEDVYRALSSESAQRWAGNLAEKQYRLLGDIEKLTERGAFTPPKTKAKGGAKVDTEPVDLLDRALDDPVLLDQLRAEYLGRTDRLASEITEASKYNDVQFIVDGTPMDSIRFLTSGAVEDPAKIQVKVLTDNPVVREHAENILRARQLLTELGNEARDVGLLAETAYRVHGSRYVRDVYRTSLEEPGLGGALKEAADGALVPDLGAFEAARLKHWASIEERVAAGAMSPAQLHGILAASVLDTTRAVEWFKLLDAVANPAKHGLPATSAAAFSVDALLAELRASGRGRKMTADKLPKVVTRGDKKYVRVPDEKEWGPLANHYVERNTYNLIASVGDAQSKAAKVLGSVIASWKYGTVVANLPSHFNQALGNYLHQFLDVGFKAAPGLVEAQLAKAARSLAQKDVWYQAARDVGVLYDTLRFDETGKMFQRLSATRNPMRATIEEVKRIGQMAQRAKGEGVGRTAQRAFDWLNVGNPVSQGLGKLWKSSDDVSKMAFFRREVQREAKQRGVTVEQALKDKDVLERAKRHVEEFHPQYEDVPLLMEKLDRYGVFPFIRYSWKVTGLYGNLHATRPGAMQLFRNIERHVHENADPEMRERLETQKPWHDRKAAPIDAVTKLFGLEGDYDVNLKWAAPLPTVRQSMSLEYGGSWGSDLYKEPVIPLPTGPVIDIPMKLLAGKDLEFGREGMSAEERAKALLYDVTPGFAGYNLGKLWDSVRDKPDRRGRQMHWAQGLAHYVGLKVEEANPKRVRQMVRAGATQARNEAARKLEYEMRKAKTEKQRQAARRRYERRMREIEDMEEGYLAGLR